MSTSSAPPWRPWGGQSNTNVVLGNVEVMIDNLRWSLVGPTI
jgi:hypothetical protein